MNRVYVLFAAMFICFLCTGVFQSWSVALAIFNLCLITAVMALGQNIQWGFAGLLNVGTMGFAALGGLTALLVSVPPVNEAWIIGGRRVFGSLVLLAIAIWFVRNYLNKFWSSSRKGWLVGVAFIILIYTCLRLIMGPAIRSIESINPALTGFLGGMGLPIIFSWVVAGLVAAGAAFCIGRISLGLRGDYLAIATLGISEIIVAFLKNEEWLTRGVKNVTGLPRPVPYEVDLQNTQWFLSLADLINANVIDLSSIFVKLLYAILFAMVLLVILWFSERALQSPWGRMMRAIRDNASAASAMGKDVKTEYLRVFVLGSAVVGIAGAMLTTFEGQFTPGTYQPLRFTFVILVMVIVGGSGNNFGSILGAFLVWFLWIQSEPLGLWLIGSITEELSSENFFKSHLLQGAAHMRMIVMGSILLLVLRFSPQGLLPERHR